MKLVPVLMVAATALAATDASAVTLTVATYTQNFDGLAATGTGNVAAIGWLSAESAANADTSYSAGTGSSNTGDTYSFGVAGVNAVSDRALGGLRSGGLVPLFGAEFTNGLGATITSFAVSYAGEFYRLGTVNRADSLAFEYSTDATSLTTGTYTGVGALTFTTPVTTGTVGARDGNAAANRTLLSGTINGLNLLQGQSLFVRFVDFDATGADDGLAVDDFAITASTAVAAVPEPAAWALLIAGFAMTGTAMRRRTMPRVTA